MLDTEIIISLLKAHKILPTKQRVDIASVLLSKPQHLSADQVLEATNQKGARVSKATVYNTLGLFARKGLVNEVFVDASKVFYDSTTVPHHHVYNVDTGQLSDLDPSTIEVGMLPDPPKGTVLDGIDIVVRVRNPRDVSVKAG